MISAINMAQQTPQMQIFQTPAFKGLTKEGLLSYTQKDNSKHNQISFKEGGLLKVLGTLGALCTAGGIGALIGVHVKSQAESILTAAIDGAAVGAGGLVALVTFGTIIIGGLAALFSDN